MNEIIKGKQPTEEQLFYKRWAFASLKESISVINDVLKIFITINIALLSALLGFYDKLPISTTIKVILFIILLVSLVCSIVGIYPTTKRIDPNMPEEIKRYKSRKIKFKSIFLNISFYTLLMVFLIALVALLFGSRKHSNTSESTPRLSGIHLGFVSSLNRTQMVGYSDLILDQLVKEIRK